MPASSKKFVRSVRMCYCFPVLAVSAVYQIATVNPVMGGRARFGPGEGQRREIAGGEKRDASGADDRAGGSLIAASNDGSRGVCSSLEVSKNFKFSYSSRARPRLRHRLTFVLGGLRIPRIYGGIG